MDKHHFTLPVFEEGQEILMLKRRNDKGVSIRKTILGFFLALIVKRFDPELTDVFIQYLMRE